MWNCLAGYYDQGFLSLQRAIHKSVIEYLNPSAASELADFELLMERFPYPPYIEDTFLTFTVGTLPLLIILSMIPVALFIAKDVAEEKEKKLKVLSTFSSPKIHGSHLGGGNWYFMLLTGSYEDDGNE